MNFHQLRIFCAIAQSNTLTQAAKQLGLAQPTLSQQLSRLEEKVGTKLFDRALGQMELTVAGQFLLRRAQLILNEVEEAQEQLREFASGTRGVIRLAGLNSIIRVVVPRAILLLKERLPEVEFDIHEMAPAEVLDLLYGRQVNIGLVAANSLAKSNISFKDIPVVTDPYVFAVPSGLGLAAVTDPDVDLAPNERKVVNSCVRFNFASQLSSRFERWYQEMLPHHRVVVQCRSYEVALGLVRAGLGVCLVPALAVHDDSCGMAGVDLYATDLPERQTVAMMSSQYQRAEPYRTFLDALREAGTKVHLPKIRPMPPFIGRAEIRRQRSPAV
jgi:DNA-binding transcriptional LysR family regulator